MTVIAPSPLSIQVSSWSTGRGWSIPSFPRRWGTTRERVSPARFFVGEGLFVEVGGGVVGGSGQVVPGQQGFQPGQDLRGPGRRPPPRVPVMPMATALPWEIW